MCGLGRFRLKKKKEKEKRKTHEDTRTWSLLVPILYKRFGSFSKSSIYDWLRS